jgi:hypothetical protein
MPLVSILKPYTVYQPRKAQGNTNQRKTLVMALGTALIITILLVWLATTSIE